MPVMDTSPFFDSGGTSRLVIPLGSESASGALLSGEHLLISALPDSRIFAGWPAVCAGWSRSAARTLSEDAGPSELALRVTGHLGCELAEVVQVTERFPSWEHVNIQRGVDAYLAARHSDREWFGASGAGHRPHEDMLSLIGHAGEVARVGSRAPPAARPARRGRSAPPATAPPRWGRRRTPKW